MADAKSRFKRPEPVASPVLGPEADQFVSGTSTQPETPRAELTTSSEGAHQVVKDVAPEREKRLTIDIPESLHKRVKAGCASQGITIADVVRRFLERKFPEGKSE